MPSGCALMKVPFCRSRIASRSSSPVFITIAVQEHKSSAVCRIRQEADTGVAACTVTSSQRPGQRAVAGEIARSSSPLTSFSTRRRRVSRHRRAAPSLRRCRRRRGVRLDLEGLAHPGGNEDVEVLRVGGDSSTKPTPPELANDDTRVPSSSITSGSRLRARPDGRAQSFSANSRLAHSWKPCVCPPDRVWAFPGA